ncbi:hypothetical protein ACFFJ4_05955 [Xanthomonas dyei]|uniref:Uncharacterized protein n=1 Tax=Xanthomonas dyei TaxID=743699 RepID=A0A2S7C802_9XANT|nr:hypothetical protein [Xanthomonas dyei]MCC4632696.1 hypothetical protein [Xanthomonas dyei pv. eucalypti]PPU57706.1 hypothetical protein XdyCFBP7245_05590 [Xanthomonas dyei]WOB26164.1 hypothetical protein NYR99_21330 [Xanthomonas dyei]WOB53788.1 hypothetical protein NYR95_21335 [Xanthomonas dyei]
MSAKTAALRALPVGSVVLILLGALRRWLPWQVSDYAQGLLIGVGMGGLLVALMLHLSRDSLRDSAPPALVHRYRMEFAPPMLGYVAVMLCWRHLLASVDANWIRVLIALLPALLLMFVVRAVARFVRDSDEMQRRIELESIAIAAGVVSMAYMTAGFLQSAQLIAVPAAAAMIWVFPVLCITYGLTKAINARRYQ